MSCFFLFFFFLFFWRCRLCKKQRVTWGCRMSRVEPSRVEWRREGPRGNSEGATTPGAFISTLNANE